MINNRLRVDGEKHLFRDTNSNAIINNNKNQYDEINKKASEKRKIERLEEELDEIKSLLKEVLPRTNK
jgi:hypothetical protein